VWLVIFSTMTVCGLSIITVLFCQGFILLWLAILVIGTNNMCLRRYVSNMCML
jgi:hypothetical protein